jgi:hypothetical protein
VSRSLPQRHRVRPSLKAIPCYNHSDSTTTYAPGSGQRQAADFDWYTMCGWDVVVDVVVDENLGASTETVVGVVWAVVRGGVDTGVVVDRIAAGARR